VATFGGSAGFVDLGILDPFGTAILAGATLFGSVLGRETCRTTRLPDVTCWVTVSSRSCGNGASTRSNNNGAGLFFAIIHKECLTSPFVSTTGRATAPMRLPKYDICTGVLL
jgi:hypothetical protein